MQYLGKAGTCVPVSVHRRNDGGLVQQVAVLARSGDSSKVCRLHRSRTCLCTGPDVGKVSYRILLAVPRRLVACCDVYVRVGDVRVVRAHVRGRDAGVYRCLLTCRERAVVQRVLVRPCGAVELEAANLVVDARGLRVLYLDVDVVVVGRGGTYGPRVRIERGSYLRVGRTIGKSEVTQREVSEEPRSRGGYGTVHEVRYRLARRVVGG